MSPEEFEAWTSRFMSVVAAEIKRYRLRRGLSAQQLSDKISEDFGLQLKRSVLANLENGRRPTLSLVELIVLARMLDVPPLLLVFPTGYENEIEVLPGQTVGTWDAARWFTGEARFPSERIPGGEIVDGIPEYYDDPEADWEEGAAPIHLRRRYDRAVAEYFKVPQHVRDMGRDEAESYQLLSRLRRPIEETLQSTREEMRKRGLTPPPIAEGLEHIDDLASSHKARRVIGDL